MFTFRISGLLVDNTRTLSTSSSTTIDIDVDAETHIEAEKKVNEKLSKLINNEDKEQR
jgi:hypothetical protein